FLRYRDHENPGRAAVMRSLWRRLKMFDGEDGPIAFRHIFAALHPEKTFTPTIYRELRHRCGRAVNRHFPHEMSLKMLLKPLDLAPPVQKMALPVLELVSHQLVG
ncbi:MAG TPA: ferritin-like domain-containing protein, partial [Verrucomicrobiae bacterium]|nr:ferritin-like domain-containing protein [Verrucomicrobiae bacterium]